MGQGIVKNIVITGASSGLGSALALSYAQPGIVLGLTGRHQIRLEQVARDCEAKGATVKTTVTDVTNEATMASWLTQFDAAHPIDLIIANAGVSGGPGVMNGENPSQVKRIFDTNLYGVINTIHPVIERMKMRKSGQVAVISSIAGFRGAPTAPAYSASKAAIRFYAQALHGLLQPLGIRVSVICPGFIKTPMTEVNTFPMPFLIDADKAAQIIKRKLKTGKFLLAFPWPLLLLARLQNLLPDWLINKIYRKLPNKSNVL